MVEIYERTLFDNKRALAMSMYYLLCSCLNEQTNIIEFDGKPMNTVDISAFTNFTRQELNIAIKDLYAVNAIVNISTRNRDFYYINPRFARHSHMPIEQFKWLTDIFDAEENIDAKSLVYFKKTHANISIDLSGIKPKQSEYRGVH